MATSGHGGARAGAGRPRNNEKYAEQITVFHDRAAADLSDRYESLKFLADGGFEQIKEEWLPAGLIFIGSGEWATLAFPNLPPEQLVCVRRLREIAAPDRAANIYLIDRVVGKPVQATEISGPDGGPVEHAHLTLDEWRAEAARRVSAAEQTLTALDDDA